jgi:CBS domain-containing protein/sporulation protein YlmC with PRC-barrel domain
MNTLSTFYLSRVLGSRVVGPGQGVLGKIRDFVVDMNSVRPKVEAAVVRNSHGTRTLDFSKLKIEKKNGQYVVVCSEAVETGELPENMQLLAKNVMDKQLVDIDGRKVVRVNDIRLAVLSNGVYVVAVDVGLEGLLRRLGVAKPLKGLLKPFGLSIPGNLILWDEVAAVEFSHAGIKLAKEHSKLLTMHPSDLADIIEDLDRNAQVAIFSSLDEEQAADVLEELETDAQISIIESISTERAANVLELMPADEAADLLDEMQEEKAEELLNEMESITSDEIRELMEYPDNEVGSIMTTEYISFNENLTVGQTLEELRRLRPESESIYYLYVLDDEERLVATVSLRDIVISEPSVMLKEIMNTKIIFIYDHDKINSLAEIITKYSLLAIPVVDEHSVMQGMVIIDDVVSTLLRSRRRRL